MKKKRIFRSVTAILALSTLIAVASLDGERADAAGAAESVSDQPAAPQEVPEPSVAAFVGAVGLLLLLRRRR